MNLNPNLSLSLSPAWSVVLLIHVCPTDTVGEGQDLRLAASCVVLAVKAAGIQLWVFGHIAPPPLHSGALIELLRAVGCWEDETE